MLIVQRDYVGKWVVPQGEMGDGTLGGVVGRVKSGVWNASDESYFFSARHAVSSRQMSDVQHDCQSTLDKNE